MRELLTDYGNLQARNGSSTIGQMSNINHSLGSEMASNGIRAMAFSKAKEYQRQANEALAKNKVPPGAVNSGGFGQIVNGVQQGVGLLKQFGIGAKAPGTAAASQQLWGGGNWSTMSDYNGGMLDAFGVFDGFNAGGGGWDSGIGSLGTSGINFFGG